MLGRVEVRQVLEKNGGKMSNMHSPRSRILVLRARRSPYRLTWWRQLRLPTAQLPRRTWPWERPPKSASG